MRLENNHLDIVFQPVERVSCAGLGIVYENKSLATVIEFGSETHAFVVGIVQLPYVHVGGKIGNGGFI